MLDKDQGPSMWERDILERTLQSTVVEHRRSRRWGIFWKTLFFGYVIFLTIMWFQGSKAKPVLKEHVALIDMIGTIGQGQEIEADNVATSLRKAFEEPKVKAVILRINSPGGTPVQSAYIYDEIRRLRKKDSSKKVYAVITDICASGAYYAAAGADKIYANESSIVGSIGVLLPGFGFVDTMKKVGIEQRTIASGKNKTFLDPFSPQNPEQVQFALGLLNEVHQQFINAVKDGRGDRLKENSEIFTGLFWTGKDALKLGLIDGFGSAGYVAREVVGVKDVIDYTTSRNFFDKLTSKMGSSISKSLVAELGLNGGMQLK